MTLVAATGDNGKHMSVSSTAKVSRISTDSSLFTGPRKWIWFAILIAPSLLFLLAFLIVPFGALVRMSLYPGTTVVGATGYSLEQYVLILSDGYFASVLLQTFIMGAEVALLCLVVGFPVGYSLARLPGHRRKWRLIAVVMPLTLSLVVIVFGWMVVLGRGGVVNRLLESLGFIDSPLRLMFGEGSVIFVLVQQFIPFMILSVMGVVSQIDSALEDASASLGANRLTTFRRVLLPLALPGISNGLLLVFILSISAFITPRLIGGNKVQMLGNLIYQQVAVVLNWPLAAALAVGLLIVTFVLLTAIRALSLVFGGTQR
ncbi:ABC transporter permease [Bradyrhizobium sp. RT11b]|uniref:ABC transporter permease n=1 Tax=Bradyrhizobium sp. RT11b TaxID=3156332 RepID=UPI00339629DA